MKVLIFVDHDGENIASSAAKLANAALQMTGQNSYDVLVAGHNIDNITHQAARLQGVGTVFKADDSQFLGNIAENIAKLVIKMAEQYDAVMAIANINGKNFMPRVAVALDVMQVSDITKIIDNKTFERPIYAGNAIQTVECNESKKIITVRETSFEAVDESSQPASIEAVSCEKPFACTTYIGEEISQSERPELTSAKIVISGGRGMQSGENFNLLENIADKLKAAVGASRAAVDAGFVSNDYQVGQTGKVVAPQLYIAVGISGAIQHLAGMKDSKIIVAINKDDEAPIFQVADYGLVADLFEALPALSKALD